MMEGEVPLPPIKKHKFLPKKMDALRRADEVNRKLQIIKMPPVRVQTTLAMTKLKTENFLSFGKSILIKRKILPRSDLQAHQDLEIWKQLSVVFYH